jgi:predicted aldo/keto reductase-like oxidoreductase
VCELNIDAYLDPKFGTKDYFVAQRAAGRIKHLGFSVHGNLDTMNRFLDMYGDVMEFCQIQLNYVDYEFQDAQGKLARLAELGIPVWVMEPLRGGGLAALEDDEAAQLKALRPDESVVAWAYRFLQSLPQVTTVLSGSSTLEQMKQNIECFAEDKPLNDEEMDTLLKIARGKAARVGVPCTACRYCTSYCPKDIDIPRLLELFNEHKFTGGGFIAPMALAAIDSDKQPESCIACGSCSAVCPQQIDIPAALEEFTALLGR